MSSIPKIALLACLVSGCATIDYVGDSYDPTTHVDLYFSKAEVAKDYRVIGQVIARGDQYTSASRLQGKLMSRAREVGADAVIVLEFKREALSDGESFEETTVESKDEKSRTVQKTGSVSSTAAEGNVIRALFIKYR